MHPQHIRPASDSRGRIHQIAATCRVFITPNVGDTPQACSTGNRWEGMHVSTNQTGNDDPRRRRRPRVTVSPAKTFAPVAIGPVSRAGGQFKVDIERAYADAQRVLDSIDFSKRDLFIWVPGTSNKGVNSDFEEAVRASYLGTGGVSLTALVYEASWNIRPSVATGIATLKLVLAGIAAHGGNHRLMLAGESQGAWVIGEAMADPMLRKVVDRAVLLGHPWLAAHHYDAGQDSSVIEVNHHGDEVAMPVKGDAAVGLDAMVAIRTLQIGKLGTVAQALVSNPDHLIKLLGSIAYAVPGLKSLFKNPHDYSAEHTRVVEFLRFGYTDGVEPADETAEWNRLKRGAAVSALRATQRQAA